MDTVLTAMVTPMKEDRSIDYDGVSRLAAYLLDNGSHGVVVNGTTGESPTTDDAEKASIISAAVAALPQGTPVWAGVGTPSTHHSIELARNAADAGATGLLVVTPYFSRPSQSAMIQHYEQIANSTDLPVMLYDIPARSSIALDVETIVRLSAHPNIVALKDAKHDFTATSWVRSRCDITIYAGDDADLLPLLAVGAQGVVGVSSHIAGIEMGEMMSEFRSGNVSRALELHLNLMPVYAALFEAPNPMLTKAALTILGLPAGPLRSPFQEASQEQIQQLRTTLAASAFGNAANF